MKKIYVAEDQPMQLEVIRQILEMEKDFQSTFFSDGLQLYQEVLQLSPDLLIVDILLPSLSGLAVTRLLKFHDDYRHIPIMVISSITDKDISDRAKEAGANSFLHKPFEVDEFLNKIRELVLI